jgi:RNA polymerase sigma factor (sigma-70 family)
MEPTTWRPAGERTEWNAIIGRYLPRLQQFAQRHLPIGVQGVIGPEDVVQEAVMKGLRQVDRIEFQHEGAFLAYLLTSIRHRIIDEIRKTRRRPLFEPLGDRDSIDPAVSPLERLIIGENAQHVAAALGRLCRRDRRLLLLRLHLRLSYGEVAVRMRMRSKDAVRMAVRRALQRLAERVAGEHHSSAGGTVTTGC